MEARADGTARGTIEDVLARFHASLDFRQLASSTRRHYEDYRRAIVAYPARHGTLGELQVDRLGPPVFRKLVDTIAQGTPAQARGTQAIPGYPTTANHWLRYLRRAFGWGIEHDVCKTNLCRGVKYVREVRNHRMPELHVFRAVQNYARRCCERKARELGALPSYLWAGMEIAHQARLRGIEVLTLMRIWTSCCRPTAARAAATTWCARATPCPPRSPRSRPTAPPCGPGASDSSRCVPSCARCS